MERSLWASLVATIVVAVVALGATLAAGWAPKLGLDLAGGLSVVYRPAHRVPGNEMDEAITIMRNRANALGVSGATVANQGGNIVVQMPGVKNPNQVISTLGSTAQLLFRPVLCTAPPYAPPTSKHGQPSPAPGPLPSNCGAQYQWTQANLGVKPQPGSVTGFTSNNVPPDPSLAQYPSTPAAEDDPSKTVLLPADPHSQFAGTRYLLGPAVLTGRAIASAQATFVTGVAGGQWVVDMTLTSAAAPRWDQIAQQYFHQAIAFDLDGLVESAPITDADVSSFQSFGGHVEISGNFSEARAKQLALVLQYGALPVRLIRLTDETVSPTLGRSSLHAGLAAGIGGLLLVLLYTVLYYRALGVVVLLGLATTASLLWAIVSALGHSALHVTLDLSGVTGLIVSVGITVDSYIVYFERLKDEVRAGRSIRTSVDRGFRSAFRTVLAADAVSFIGALVLWWLAVGDVKGFAFFLGLSTLLDVFTTFFFTRPLVILLGRSRTVTEAPVLGVARGLAAEPVAAPVGK
jgi:preprotein translocase subunit SecD